MNNPFNRTKEECDKIESHINRLKEIIFEIEHDPENLQELIKEFKDIDQKLLDLGIGVAVTPAYAGYEPSMN